MLIRHAQRKGGVTLLEIIVIISTMATLSGLTVTTFADFRARKSCDAAVAQILSALSSAHFDTVTAKNDLEYGIQLRAKDYILFSGNTAPASDTDPRVLLRAALPGNTEITNINLSGGGSYVFFQRPSGTTPQSGTFTIRSTSKSSILTTATIHKTGAVSI